MPHLDAALDMLRDRLTSSGSSSAAGRVSIADVDKFLAAPDSAGRPSLSLARRCSRATRWAVLAGLVAASPLRGPHPFRRAPRYRLN